MPHQDDVGLWKIVGEEASGRKRETLAHADRMDVLLENRPDFWKVESAPSQMRIRERDLRRQIALRGADVDERVMVLPRETARDGHVRAAADPGHRGQKAFQSSRIGIQGFEHARPAGPDFVLRLAGAERFGEMAPERIQPLVRHLENAADVGRLLAVEKEVRLRSVRIQVPGAREKTERHERIQEIARRPRVQPQTSARVPRTALRPATTR